MEKSVSDVFTDDLKQQIAGIFGTTADQLHTLGDFENYVFKYPYEDTSRILRITHHSHRDAVQLQGELDWVHHLATHGVSVSRPLLSPNGNWIETFVTGEHTFYATAFSLALGGRITDEDWGDDLFQQWGQVIGQMHRVTDSYQPKNEETRRFHWHQDHYVANALDIVPESFPIVRTKWVEIMAELKQLPQTEYGLVHVDVHAGNFHLHNGKMTVFDCDDCNYHWYMFDIAIVLYYALWGKPVGKTPTERADFARHFMTKFWQGYRQEFDLPQWWWGHIPTFFKLRDLELFTVLTLKLPRERSDQQQQMIDRFQNRIEQDTPYVDVDFLALAKTLYFG